MHIFKKNTFPYKAAVFKLGNTIQLKLIQRIFPHIFQATRKKKYCRSSGDYSSHLQSEYRNTWIGVWVWLSFLRFSQDLQLMARRYLGYLMEMEHEQM